MLDVTLHHVSLNVRNVERATEFYRSVFGWSPLPRPDLGVTGTWFDIGGEHQLHLIGTDVPPDCGQHVAFAVTDLDAAVAALRAAGVEVADPIPVGDTAMRQTFFADPDGNRLELNQPA